MSRTLIAMQGAAICLVVVLSLCTTYTKCASMAHHHTHQTNKERVEDGGFAPRDHEHMKSGEHHSEFDHEAILGNRTIKQTFSINIPMVCIEWRKEKLRGNSHKWRNRSLPATSRPQH